MEGRVVVVGGRDEDEGCAVGTTVAARSVLEIFGRVSYLPPPALGCEPRSALFDLTSPARSSWYTAQDAGYSV